MAEMVYNLNIGFFPAKVNCKLCRFEFAYWMGAEEDKRRKKVDR